MNTLPEFKFTLPTQPSKDMTLVQAGILAGGVCAVQPHHIVMHSNAPHHLLWHCDRGQATLLCGKNTTRIDPSYLIIAPAGIDCRIVAGEKTCTVTWFHLHDSARWRFLHNGNTRTIRPKGWNKLQGAMILYGRELLLARPCDATILKSLGDVIIALIQRGLAPAGGVRSEEMHEKYRELWHEVTTNPSYAWSIAKMAGHFHVSAVRFSHMTKEAFGRTPMAMVTEIRMKKAAMILCQSVEPLKAIAEQVGYGDPFAFSTAFKRFWGLAPSRYRQLPRADTGTAL